MRKYALFTALIVSLLTGGVVLSQSEFVNGLWVDDDTPILIGGTTSATVDFKVLYDEVTDNRLEITDGADNLMLHLTDGGTTGNLSATGNTLVPDDQFMLFGTNSDHRVSYDELTDNRLEFTDSSGNLMMHLTDAGTTGNLVVTGTITGTGGGFIDGSGTLNTIPKFTPDGDTVGDSDWTNPAGVLRAGVHIEAVNGTASEPAYGFTNIGKVGMYADLENLYLTVSDTSGYQAVRFKHEGFGIVQALFSNPTVPGSATEPQIADVDDEDTGIFWDGTANTLGITTAGIERARVSSGGLNLATGTYQTAGTQISSDDLSDTASIAMLDEAETVAASWTFTPDQTFTGDVTINGGDLIVGSAATGNVGTTTNPNQLNFLTANTTTVSGDGTIGFLGVGTNDSERGQHRIFGDATTGGALLDMRNAAGEDTTVDQWRLEANGGLEISDSTTVALTIQEDLDTKINKALLQTIGTAFVDGDATPTVAGGNVFKCGAQTTTVTITALDDGEAGQVITIIAIDADTDISDAGTLKLSAAWTPDADDTLQLVFDGTNWFEIQRSAN